MTGAILTVPASTSPPKSNIRHRAAYFIGDEICIVPFVVKLSGELKLPNADALRGLKLRASFCPSAICSGVILFSKTDISFLDGSEPFAAAKSSHL
jgi:hypothetical protein